MTSPLCRAQAIHPEEGVVLAQDLLCALVFSLVLAQAAGATTTTMWLRMTASRVLFPSAGVCVCVCLISSREGLPSDAIPIAGRIHPPQRLQRHTPSRLRTSASPWGDVS
jgi:hypothetical protein